MRPSRVAAATLAVLVLAGAVSAPAPSPAKPEERAEGVAGRSRGRTVPQVAVTTADSGPAAASIVAVRPGRRATFFAAEPRPGELPRVARALLAEQRAALGVDAMPGSLRIVREFGSLTGWHLRHVQVLGGVPVHASEVSVHVAPDGRPLRVVADIHPLEGVGTTPRVAGEAALATVRDLLADDGVVVRQKLWLAPTQAELDLRGDLQKDTGGDEIAGLRIA